ncbi:uncharacterized protein LOC133314203 [Gastrolobium bilobum]|uniref:uncharacterized protein LOC133314203 n=1 Tax=Gastrolobium bilobum TaxID=150636 RepID=UPI002AB1AECC|nr:uncharacterized protein LOC133314203 [Gastrolobium bilobum]
MQTQRQQQQQLDVLIKQLSSQKVASVDTKCVCAICGKGHVTEECDYGGSSEQAEVNGVWYDNNNQRNYNNQGRNVYVPPWKNKNQHPGFSYSSNHQLNPPLHPPPTHSSQPSDTAAWEKAFAQLSKTTQDYIQGSNSFREETSAFMQETKTSFRNQKASIRNLETQIGQLSRQISERPHGKFPSDTMVNPKEHCKAIMTRSGLVLQQVKKNVEDKKNEEEVVVEDVVSDDGVEKVKGNKEKETVKEDKEEKEVVVENDVVPKKIMKWEKKKMADKQDQPVTLSPYAKALENMPHYAKFMKDLLTKKRKLNDGETVALTAECSALIQKKLPPKLQDPGSFSISIAIGDVEVGKALCDLGASINLMPLTGKLLLRVDEETVTIDVFEAIKHPVDVGDCFRLDVIQEVVEEVELKELPSNLKYVFLGDDQTYPVIINAMLSESEEVKLIKTVLG